MMHLERTAGNGTLVDVLDRVLDKGIVVDAWVRVSLAGINLITLEARMLVASFETYLKHADVVAQFTRPLATALSDGSPGTRAVAEHARQVTVVRGATETELEIGSRPFGRVERPRGFSRPRKH